MADKKLSELTAADALTGTEVFAAVQGGVTKKATAQQIKDFASGSGETQRLEGTAPALEFSETDTTDDNWAIKANASLLKVEELDDTFATTGTHHTFTHGGGTQFGAPTGGDQGAGTVNATGLFEGGVGVAKLSGGADANFTAMPRVGGNPIVESDSNAGGAYTRFADGSMSQRVHRLTLPFSNAADCTGTWTLPAAFVGTDYTIEATFIASLDSNGPTALADDATPTRSQIIGFGTGNYTTTSVSVSAHRISGGTDFTSGDNLYASVAAHGDWL